MPPQRVISLTPLSKEENNRELKKIHAIFYIPQIFNTTSLFRILSNIDTYQYAVNVETYSDTSANEWHC